VSDCHWMWPGAQGLRVVGVLLGCVPGRGGQQQQSSSGWFLQQQLWSWCSSSSSSRGAVRLAVKQLAGIAGASQQRATVGSWDCSCCMGLGPAAGTVWLHVGKQAEERTPLIGVVVVTCRQLRKQKEDALRSKLEVCQLGGQLVSSAAGS
jgi:hypothetical protein